MLEIDHEIRIEATPEEVFAALSTRDGLAAWHTPNVTGSGDVGGEWVMTFTGRPEFGWEVIASEAPRRVAWRCTRGPGDSVGTTATFTLAADGDRTLVELQHAGWPGTHGNFRKCNTLWGVLLHHLRDYAETGDTATAFD